MRIAPDTTLPMAEEPEPIMEEPDSLSDEIAEALENIDLVDGEEFEEIPVDFGIEEDDDDEVVTATVVQQEESDTPDEYFAEEVPDDIIDDNLLHELEDGEEVEAAVAVMEEGRRHY